MILSIDAEKAFNKIQCWFMIKTQKNKNRGELPQLDKEHLFKLLTVNVIPNDERWNAFPQVRK